MLWYYLPHDRPVGPVSQQELRLMLDEGRLPPDVFVKHDGMAHWKPAHSISWSKVPQAALPLVDPAHSIERAKGAPSASPTVSKPTAPLLPGHWHDDRFLVTQTGGGIPERCIKCNAPSTRKFKKRLQWHHPVYYLVALVGTYLLNIPVGVALYLATMLLATRFATIHFGLCDQHQMQRKCVGGVGALFIVASVGGIFLPIVTSLVPTGLLFPFFGLGFLFLLKSRATWTKRIDSNHFVWVGGCNETFLKSLPQWKAKP